MIDFEAAAEFVWRHGRLLDRRRFAHHFVSPDPDGITAAVLAYRNPDGGFGNALEPDCRTPHSQPEPTRLAMSLLDEAGRLDAVPLEATVEWLASIATPDGGIPFCLPTVEGFPRAPWWTPPDPPSSTLNPTGGIVGLLRKAGTQHPWLDRAEAFCWRQARAADVPDQYQIHNLEQFLHGLPSSADVDEATAKLCGQLAEGRIVALDPARLAGGDPHTPLDVVPDPRHPLRRAFDDGVINAFLDHLEGLQQDDGGWPVAWPAPGPTAVFEWRAVKTVAALRTLRAYGRSGA